MRASKSKQRLFEGLPVREGRGDILVQPTKSDIKSATPHDPENCAYARCLRRMLETTRVYVYTSVCYVETLDETGRPIMERYMVRNHAHAYIQKFDAGEEVNPGGFILHRPTGNSTLEYKRQASRTYARQNPDKVKEYYKISRKRAKERKAKERSYTHKELRGSFRDGTGQVHFTGQDGSLAVRKWKEDGNGQV